MKLSNHGLLSLLILNLDLLRLRLNLSCLNFLSYLIQVADGLLVTKFRADLLQGHVQRLGEQECAEEGAEDERGHKHGVETP